MSNASPANNVCPFLGLEDDADSAQAFPSNINYCYRSSPIAPVKLDHQAEFCLAGKHRECPVFLREETGRLPGHIRAHRSRAPKNRRISRINIFTIVIALIVIIVLEWQFLSQTKTAIPTYTASSLPVKTLTSLPTITMTPLPAPATVINTPTLHIPFFGSVTVTSSLTLTPSVTATEFVSKHQLDVPIGTDRKFIIHRLAEGERLDPHVMQYNTSIEAVKAINYYLYLVNPVQRDVLIIFPLNFTDVSGMHVLVIYQVREDERGINIEYLAQKFKVDLTDLKYYNGITIAGDRPLVGDLFLIPQPRLVP